ncbi:hypothetical protein C2S53_014623 [Perilla frutescens var. hirtella]|uniref:Uncharacterized protein n=1 Tax=Perilla frutescens var. hirtella TaxID=608512 RepID=A0AAD4JK13_PERFH|nr:hypothetical protein C2S53_014623 [Perilla frutescens var. hirtella]
MTEKLDQLAKSIAALQVQLSNNFPRKGMRDEESILGPPPQNYVGEGSQSRTQYTNKAKALVEPYANQMFTPLPRVDFPKFDGINPRVWVLSYTSALNIVSGDYLDYVDQFEELKECMAVCGQGIYTEPYFVASSLSGLSEELKAAITMFNPTTLQQTQMIDRRALGICYNCDDRYTPRHRCTHRVHYMIMSEEEEVAYLQPLINMEEEPGPEAHMEETQMSLHALKGNDTITTLKFNGTCNRHNLRILMETGRTLSFIKDSTTHMLGCKVETVAHLLIKVANGQRLISSSKT